jgi:hypothetical protein
VFGDQKRNPDHTIKNWFDYVKTTESDHGAFNVSIKPTIGFLIKYLALP